MKYLIFLFVLVAIAFPQFQVLAQSGVSGTEIPNDIVSCKDGGACNFCDLTKTINKTTQWLTGITLFIGIILFIYAGYRIASARGDVGIVTEARKMMGNVAIGVLILILALSIVDILLKTTTGGGYGVWTSVRDCGFQKGAGKSAPKYKSDPLKVNPGAILPEIVDDTSSSDTAP